MSILTKKFPKSFHLYCLCGGFFIIGYFIGAIQISDLCSGRNDISKVDFQEDTKTVIKKHSAFLILVIFSSPPNYDRRQVIRKTWLLSRKNLSILHFFAVGIDSINTKQFNALQYENNAHGDLLMLDSVKESFSKLSLKLREIFRWLDKNVDYDFLLKVDDDSFVRLDALYSKLIKQPKERLHWGFFDGRAKVKSKGKWTEKTWFLCDRYLPYALGGGYVVSRDLIHNLVLVSDYLSLYKNEDVSLGTWLSPFEITRLHDPLFDTEYVPRGCFNSYLVTHKQSTAMMYSKYENLRRTGNLCTSEYKSRNSYEYNWNVLPSQCCQRNNSQIP